MGTVKKRGNFQYQGIIRLKGYPHKTGTFESEREAKAWVKATEAQMLAGVFRVGDPTLEQTFNEILDRYLKEVTPSHKGADSEEKRDVGSGFVTDQGSGAHIGESAVDETHHGHRPGRLHDIGRSRTGNITSQLPVSGKMLPHSSRSVGMTMRCETLRSSTTHADAGLPFGKKISTIVVSPAVTGPQ